MTAIDQQKSLVGREDLILVTGATGFIGTRVVHNLMARGFRNIRCLVRPSSQASKIAALCNDDKSTQLEVFRGNLLSPDDCKSLTEGVAVVIHLAAGRGEKSFPDAYMNSVVTTRNLLEACSQQKGLRRFVNVSSFAVYDNTGGSLLDESCPLEARPEVRGEAYCFAKTKQDEIVMEYGEKHKLPYTILRPGAVYGPGNLAITGRVGIGTFGLFLHLGGSNTIPLTYVDNCAEAIVLAAITPGVDGEVFNIVDDELPSSRQFLRLYKRNVKSFPSLYLPKPVSYWLCYLWERYSERSQGQLPPVFNRSRWNSFWRNTRYTNQKLKSRLGWRPVLSTSEGLRVYFEACKVAESHA